MRLALCRYGLVIYPEDQPDYDEQDTAFIEEVLGLKKDGDAILLVRKDDVIFPRIARLETQINPRRDSLPDTDKA